MNGEKDQSTIDDELKERLERARGIDERDRVYAFAAMRAADHADPRALELADKIEDSDTRKGVTTFVDYSFIKSLIRKKQPNEAVILIRKSNLTHTLRAHYLTQVATTSITLEGKFGIRMCTELASPTDLAEAFEILAAENFYQAIDVSKNGTTGFVSGFRLTSLFFFYILRVTLLAKQVLKTE